MAKQDEINQDAGGGNKTDANPEYEDYQSVEEMEKDYPELVKEIRAGAVEKAEKKFEGRLRKKIKAEVEAEMDTRPAHLKIPGFLLEVDDPFVAGVARTYGALKKIDPPALPCILPFKEKPTADALENYILRAKGAGDSARAGAAEKALGKVK